LDSLRNNESALTIATEKHNIGIVKLLLEDRADVNDPYDGKFALTIAVERF